MNSEYTTSTRYHDTETLREEQLTPRHRPHRRGAEPGRSHHIPYRYHLCLRLSCTEGTGHRARMRHQGDGHEASSALGGGTRHQQRE